MQLFYAPDIKGDEYTLSEEESRHCTKVLRLNIGDDIILTDGNGVFYKTKLFEINSRKCKLQIKSIENQEARTFKLHIAIAPTKNTSRFEWFLEKATEIGIDEISPIICQHSERKHIKIDRLNKIIVSAMKQSLKAYCPVLNEAITFNKFIKKSYNHNKYIAYCETDTEEQLKKIYNKPNDALIMIGPEGDFSKEEVALSEDAGFRKINLGKSRLRTETAAIVACHTIILLND